MSCPAQVEDAIAPSKKAGGAADEQSRRGKKKKEGASLQILIGLEKKLVQAIKEQYRERKGILVQLTESEESKQSKRVMLTNRDLYPYYLVTDITSFMDTFAKVDEDMSGDIDINEWVQLFAIINKNISEHQARNLFARIDDDNDNYVTIGELIPIVFSNLQAHQRKKVIKFVEYEMKKKKSGGSFLTSEDVDQLFSAYDAEDIGFVPISLFRDHMKSMLFEGVYVEFKDSISGVKDDEMVNQLEFARLLKPYMI